MAATYFSAIRCYIPFVASALKPSKKLDHLVAHGPSIGRFPGTFTVRCSADHLLPLQARRIARNQVTPGNSPVLPPSARNNSAPIAPPISGPTIGTQEYAQSEEPLPRIGRMAWATRGPRSRAGLIAYPVGPPSEAPMPTTSSATNSGPRPDGVPPEIRITNTRTKVARISVMVFQP